MADSAEDPEIGRAVRLDDATVNVLEAGSGPPVLLIHGSGPGVTAFANWRLIIPRLQEHYRVVAPDMPRPAPSPPISESILG